MIETLIWGGTPDCTQYSLLVLCAGITFGWIWGSYRMLGNPDLCVKGQSLWIWLSPGSEGDTVWVMCCP